MAKLSNGCPTTNVYVLLSTAICEDCQYSNMWGLSVQQYVRTVSTAIWGHYSVQRYGDTTQYSNISTQYGNVCQAGYICTYWHLMMLQRYGDTTQYSNMGTLLSTAIWEHYSVQRYMDTTHYSSISTQYGNVCQAGYICTHWHLMMLLAEEHIYCKLF